MSCLIHTSICVSSIPADHLIPPPLPHLQRLPYVKTSAYTEYKPGLEPAQRIHPKESNENTGLMTRIARWFGYPTEQQLTAESQRQAYYYSKSNTPADQSDPCYLCNQAPWLPMMAPSIQYPFTNKHQQYFESDLPTKHTNGYGANNIFLESITHQRLPSAQRSVKFAYPAPAATTASSHPYLTTPQFQPVKSPAFIQSPPVAQQYKTGSFPSLHLTSLPPTTAALHTAQQLPSTEFAHFTENVGAHSELQLNRVVPTRTSHSADGAADNSVEIIKSQQISHFVSSVEYPVTFLQAQTVDVGLNGQEMPKTPNDADAKNSVEYHNLQLIPNLSKYTPASEILTQPTGFGDSQSGYREAAAFHQPSESSTQSVPTAEYLSEDNFPSASSHNATEIRTTDAEAWHVEQNELYYTTLEPPRAAEAAQASVQPSLEDNTNSATQKISETSVEFIPSLEIKLPHKNTITNQNEPFWQRHIYRETPKRLLDSPIQHDQRHNGMARPFTLDPGKLNLRLVGINSVPQEFHHSNHDYTEATQANDAQLVTTTTTLLPIPQTTAGPTPTSTYGAIDASGQFAGMSPRVPPTAQQIFIPFGTQNRPRPFKATFNVQTRIEAPRFHDFQQQQHTQTAQPSNVVSSATATPKTPYTPKYLTKILASNLRELLKHEQERKNRTKPPSIDISKLQKNIDDWTEQEYSSLSHLPSTPTIRGRSKHIPFEYFTTASPFYDHRMTKSNLDASALPTSINSLESDLVAKDLDNIAYASIGDNSLLGFYEARFAEKERALVTKRTTTTTEKPWKSASESFTPYYIRAVPVKTATELWNTAKVAISPQTMEKVYVVTPQPRFFPQRMPVTSTEAPLLDTRNILNINKAPRFVVRPTPGNSTAATSATFYTPELFGLTGLSAYVPEKPIEINDGNSKVATIATPPDSKSSATKMKTQQRQSMSPLPR